jgi:pimeloyl-ACP methyl ester carboxylesterase
MRLFKKILKYSGFTIVSFLLLTILVGLGSRLFTPEPNPPGKLVDVGGFRLHINATGKRNKKPTLVIESGAGAPSEYYYWLGELLKDSIRVIRYDRAGIGYSEQSNTKRNPETIARELHTLLERAGESPPYIMAGHSYGGHNIRVFKELYPSEVVAMVLLDSGHPDEQKRLNMPPSPSWLNNMYYVGAVLGDLGVLNSYSQLVAKRPVLWAPGLPEEVIERFNDYTVTGKYLWGYLEEEKEYSALVETSRQAIRIDTIPIRVFSGTYLNESILIKMGLNPEYIRTERGKMQEEMTSLSSNGKVIFLDGGHITIFSQKENATIICNEILSLLKQLGY